MDNLKIGFIGGGNMARAIAEGILKKGLIRSSQLMVSAPSQCTLDVWNSLSVGTTNCNAKVIMDSDVIILAVKPHQLDSAMEDLRTSLPASLPSKLFVSVLAGVPCYVLHTKLSINVNPNVRVIRVMPNTLATICEGCSAIATHRSTAKEDVDIVQRIFLCLGKCEIVPENSINAVTGLSGSGPAYVYTIIEALSDGGVKQGLPRSLATTFAAQTVLGAAKMVLETKKHPGQLKDEVCSAGGTTIHGLYALEKGGLRAALMSAVEAATMRGEELSKLYES